MGTHVVAGDCREWLDPSKLSQEGVNGPLDLTFLDPPFNQNKEYAHHFDALPESEYWDWLTEVSRRALECSSEGGGIYLMHREKNAAHVISTLERAGWTFQNLVIWRKKTSAVPSDIRFGKQYQIIAFATRGPKPRVFNRLRIDPPLPQGYRYPRKEGMFVTDVWDDIRELTSGYFAGDEALRRPDGSRYHKQQMPIQLILRILLASTLPGDVVMDPFAGTGTTLVTARQLGREAVGIEVDPANVTLIQQRLDDQRDADDVARAAMDYTHTPNLSDVWGSTFPDLAEGPAA